MQFFKAIALVGAALASVAQAAPAAPNHGAGNPWGQQQTTSPATATAVQTAAQTSAEAQTQAAGAATAKSPDATQEASASAVKSAGTASSPSKATASAAQPSSSSGSTSSSGGQGVTVLNSCSETIYVTVSQGGGNGNAQPVSKGGSSHFPLSGSDMNLKIGPQQDVFSGNIAQVEYSISGSSMSWDLSLINGNPFKAQGTSLVPSGSNLSGNCKAVHCAPGAATCPNAYNSNADNSLSVQPTLTCPTGTALTFTACSG